MTHYPTAQISPRLIVCGAPGAGKSALLRQLPGLVALELPAGSYAEGLVPTAPGTALVVIDATEGVTPAAARDRNALSLFGISELGLAINKMDQVGYAESAYRGLVAAYAALSPGNAAPVAIPLAALAGDNVGERSANMPWYSGPTLREHLDAIGASPARTEPPLRFVVQSAARAAGLAIAHGTILSGSVRRGERIRVLPEGRESGVIRIEQSGSELESASAGDAVALVLEAAVELEPGMMLVAPQAPATVADQIQATLLWMHDEPMFPSRSYQIEIAGQTLLGSVTAIRHKLDLESSARLAARQLAAGEIGSCNLSLERPAVFDSFRENRATGGFWLRDEASKRAAGFGLVHFALRRAHNIHRQAVDVDQTARAAMKGQRPCVLWFTGLSASGKSTIANLVEKRLYALGRHTYLLDGDNVRHGLNKDLGFTDTDRVENIRRVAEVAKLMVDAGLIVLVSFISPFRAERRMARELLRPGEFLEVFVDVPLAEAERRDPKGLYRKARRGELQHFTGIDSPYEAPENPELHLDTFKLSPEAAAELVLERLEADD